MAGSCSVTRRQNIIMGLLASIPPAVAGAPALAADAPAVEADPGTAIVVTAPRREKTARSEQAVAINVVNIQSAETIAKYPDVNAAEALSRMPGVALSIDTGEGRFVNIRGLDGNLNGSTFGGVVLLNTQPGGTYFNAAGRAVEFDTVPVGSIDRIVVTKTGLPDQEAEGLGGTVELTPRTAIGIDKPFAEVTLGAGYEFFRKQPLIREEVVVGGGFGGVNADGRKPFSIVLTQFILNDRRGFDDIEAAYINDQTNGTPDKAFDALELRRYNYHRQRFGYSGEFDFKPNDDNRFFLRANLAGYTENVQRQRFEIDGLGNAVTVDPANANGFVATGASTVKTLRDERENHRNLVVQIGGDHRFGEIKLDYFAAFSRATYRKFYDYNTTFAGPGELTVGYDNTTDSNHPKFTVQAGADPLNLANYALDGISNATEYDRDQEYSYAANLAVPVGLLEHGTVKAGGKLRYRNKTSTPLNFTYAYAGAAPVPLAQFITGNPITDFYSSYNIGPDLNARAVRSFFDTNQADFTRNLARDLQRNASGFFDDTENVTAGYAQFTGTTGRIGVLAGVRVEHTKAIYRGTSRVVDAAGAVSFTPATTPSSYTNVFPTLQLRYQAMPSLVARATYSTGIARPGFFQTIQSSRVDVGAQTVTTGNPALKPTYGQNFDLSLEYYLPDSGIISFGLFDKEFRNYIVARSDRGPYMGYAGTFLISTFQNVSNAYARGFEASFVDRLRGGALRGFGVDLNATYSDTGIALRRGENVALPGAFKWSGNAAMFYELRGVKARLSAQYQSPTLFGIGSTRATDYFQDKRLTLDFGSSYDLTRNVSLYFNAKNLTNEPLRFYEGSKGRPGQREYYDATVEGGVKLRF